MNETFPFPLCSCGHLHWHGNQDGSQLPVQVSETICSGKVSSFRFLLFHFYIINCFWKEPISNDQCSHASFTVCGFTVFGCFCANTSFDNNWNFSYPSLDPSVHFSCFRLFIETWASVCVSLARCADWINFLSIWRRQFLCIQMYKWVTVGGLHSHLLTACVSLTRRLIDSAQSKCLVSAVPLFQVWIFWRVYWVVFQVTFYMADWVASFSGFWWFYFLVPVC